MNPIVKSLVMGAVGAAALLASACNTVEGVGRDVEEVGDEIQETSNDAR